LPIKHQMYLF